MTEQQMYLSYILECQDKELGIYDEDFGSGTDTKSGPKIRRHLPQVKKEESKSKINRGGVNAYKNKKLAPTSKPKQMTQVNGNHERR